MVCQKTFIMFSKCYLLLLQFLQVNLKKKCPFWEDDSQCAIRYCSVKPCTDVSFFYWNVIVIFFMSVMQVIIIDYVCLAKVMVDLNLYVMLE